MIEPDVMESIAMHKSNIAFYRTLRLLIAFAFPLVSLVIIFQIFRSGKVNQWDAIAVGMIFFIIVFALIFILLPLRLLKSSMAKGMIASRIEKEAVFLTDPGLLRKFRNGLEAASLAFGIPTPGLIVIEFPGVTSLAYKKGKETVVAVSAGAVLANLSVEEADAVMAERIAHIVIGDTVKSTDDLNGLITLLLIIGTGSCAGFLIAMTGLGGSYMIILLATYIAVGLISVIWVSYPTWKLEAVKYHTELLTDSIAAKITGHPTALKDAFLKLNSVGLMGKMETIADFNKVVYEAAHGPVPQYLVIPNPFKSSKRPMRQFAARIENLEAIEKGRWSEFDIEHGTVARRLFKWQ